MSTYSVEQIQQNKRYSIKHGIYSSISQNIYSAFLSLYAIQALHATNQQIGFINSLPQLVNLLVMVPGAILMNRLLSKKPFTALTVFFARLFYFVIALIPFILWGNSGWLLVIAVALLSIPNSLSQLSWQSFIGDLIPQEDRGKFFGVRNRMSTFAAMITVFSVGLLLNLFDKSNPLPYQFFFTLAFVIGMVEVMYLNRHIEIPRTIDLSTQQSKRKNNHLKLLIKEKPFLLFLTCSLVFNFGWQMAWPLFSIYNIQYADASALWLSLFTVVSQIAQIISFPFWGKMADKYGNMMILFVVSCGMAVVPTITVISTNYFYLLLTNFFSGLSLSGTTLLLFNQTLNLSPDEGRTTFIATYNVVIGIIGFIAPLVGTTLLDHLGMMTAMNISTLLRFCGAFAFLAVALLYERKKA